MNTSSDMLDGWLQLADAIDANGSTEALDIELLVQQSHLAARGLRSLVATLRGSETNPGDAPAAPEAPEDEIWMPDGMGGGVRVKVKGSTEKP